MAHSICHRVFWQVSQRKCELLPTRLNCLPESFVKVGVFDRKPASCRLLPSSMPPPLPSELYPSCQQTPEQPQPNLPSLDDSLSKGAAHS